MPRPRNPASPFRDFDSSPEVIRLVVMIYVQFPLSLLYVEDLLTCSPDCYHSEVESRTFMIDV